MDNSFLLQTKGYCLSCLGKNKNEIKSVQSILNYLSVDVEKIFSSAFGVSTDLIQEMDLQGTFCEKCGESLDELVEIREEMETLKVKFDSCLRTLLEKMKRSEDGIILEEFRGQMNSPSTFLCLRFVEQLRKEMMIGCSQTVGNSTPEESNITEIVTFKKITPCKMKERIFLPTPPKKTFLCNLCPRNFSHKLLLVRHRRKFHPELHLQCDMCPAIYYFTETLKRHKLTVHSGNDANNYIPSVKVKPEVVIFRCDVCNKTFSRNSSLKEHMNAIHLNVWFNCDRCGGSFKWRNTFKKHRQRCRNVRHPRKQKSLKSFQPDVRRDYEIRPRTNRPNYNLNKIFLEQLDPSNISNASSSSRPRLILKLNINKDSNSPQIKKSFKCGHCPKTYTRKIRKLDHERVVHHGILLQCGGCAKQFRTKDSLRIHRNYVHENKNKTFEGMPTLIKFQPEFQCIWCLAKFEGSEARDIHMQRNCPSSNCTFSIK